MPRTTDSSRDLLFALLALQNNLIDQDRLLAALRAWSRDTNRPMAEVLVAEGGLDAQASSLLNALLVEHLKMKKHGGDSSKSLPTLSIDRTTHEGLARAGAWDLARTLGPVDATLPERASDELTVGNARSAAINGGERFRVLRGHAQGGLGAVFVALDTELHREVALKQIQDKHADDPVSRARFLLEAEITGNLEHPGIVPVYGLGTYGNGRPYYAMRFVRGDSLKEAIESFHSDGALKHDPGRRSLELRKLLRRFIDVCNAIEYAHGRGILHRDIKPSNVIVGKHGETLVVDWGLAKAMGKSDPIMADHTLMPPSASGSAGTLPGSTLGTPAYMSPEQAEGKLELVGPQSDVYSLGATLYCLLTGRPPFEGGVADILRAARQGEFPPPRQLDPSVDRALETICLKAMATRPVDRYASSRALADDVECWLADEPVGAYREGRLERVTRWLRRHRTWTYAAGAALIGIAIAATVGVVLVERGRRREAEARALAEMNYNLAKRAVDDYFTQVSEDTLLKEQDSVDIRRLRGELLTTALGYYREFLKDRSGDPKLRRELAEAQFRVGQIMREIGKPDETLAAFKASIAIWEEQLAAAPGDPAVAVRLARALLALGEQYGWIQDFPAANAALTRSRGIYRQLAALKPADVPIQLSLAECDKELGIVQGERGAPEQDIELLREAESILRRLLAAWPADAGYRERLADTINAQGFAHFRMSHEADALGAFREFQTICQSLLDSHTSGPKPARLVNSLALSYYNVGAILYRQDHMKALEYHEKALGYRRALVAAHPSVNDFRNSLAISLMEVAPLRHEAGRNDDALAAISQAVEILDKLLRAQPHQPRLRAELGRALLVEGFLFDEERDNARALETFKRGISEAERALAEAPEADLYKVQLADLLWNLGEQYVDFGRVDDGLPYYRRAVEICRQVHASRHGDADAALALADQLGRLAAVERSSGRAESARRTYAAAAAVLDPLASDGADQKVQIRRGALALGEGRAAADQGLTDQALTLLRRAVALLTPVVAAPKDIGAPRQRLTEALWETARLARGSGSSALADRLDSERRALWQDRPPGELGALVLEEIAEAARIGYGRVPLDPPAEAVKRLGLDLAADNLRTAVSLGFRDFAMIGKHPDSALLLSRSDVPLALYDFGFPADPLVPEPAPH